MKNLIEFLSIQAHTIRSRSEFVSHPGFCDLYVRRGPRVFDETIHPDVITIARIEATHKGKGAFTKLLKLLSTYNVPICCECVLNDRLKVWLVKNGFVLRKYMPDEYWNFENGLVENT